jgi:hypothetical protein
MYSVLDTTKTLRPGILVSLNTHVAGNASYKREVIEAEAIDANGTLTEKFVTDKKILDAAEQEAACQTRDKARNIVARVCAKTAFGYLCPEANDAELRVAIKEAQVLVDTFNETAKVTRVAFFPLTGRVAADDEEAVKRINKEVRSLVAVMEDGVRNLDVKKIREAADEARQLGQMLNPDAQARITIAIEAARTAARAIKKAGETAAQEIDTKAIRAMTEVRTAFLDMDPATDVATPGSTGRAVDFTPTGGNDTDSTGKKLAVPAAVARQMDI